MQSMILSGSASYVGSNVLLFLGPDPGISEAVRAVGTVLNRGSSLVFYLCAAEAGTWSCF